eukprot:scaffold2343_cov146-Amphora_coffeaeformis.AAC.1
MRGRAPGTNLQSSKPALISSPEVSVYWKHKAGKSLSQAPFSRHPLHHRTSTAASIAARDIVAYLTSVTIGDGRFKGTTVEFLMHWVQQVKLYQKLMGNSSTFGDTEKLIHLQRAVATIHELRQIKTTADMLTATSGKPM